MNSPHILVVDDEEDIAELVRYNLTSEGYHVSCAGSGEDAIRLIRSKTGLIWWFWIIMLPGMSGIKVAETLRSDPKFHEYSHHHADRQRRRNGYRHRTGAGR